MSKTHFGKIALIAICLTLSNFTSANAQSIQVEVENLQGADGFFFTPVWVGAHDGSFDLFDVGGNATAGLELLAEEGDFSVLSSEFAGSGTDGGVFSPGGFAGAPVFDPGEIASAVFNLGANDRYLSFASMIIPSNDGFFGNEGATDYEIFDADGNFTGPIDIIILGGDLWDSGTEVNDGLGAAFSAVGGTSTQENGVVGAHQGLANFLGTGTAAGTNIGSIPGADTPIARISIRQVPEPTSFGFITALAGLASIGRRRKA